MVAGGLVDPALIRVRGIFRDLRLWTVLVNSTHEIFGFLPWNVHTDTCLCTCIYLRTDTGYPFLIVGSISDASNQEICRYVVCYSTGRLSCRDGYLLDFGGEVHYNWCFSGIDYIYYYSNSQRSFFDFVHLRVFLFVSWVAVGRVRCSKPSLLERLVFPFWFGPKIRV